MFDYKERPMLVHRLDKDTSGVLLLARTPRVARRLSESFRHRNTRKIYWALVAGVPQPLMGTVRYGLLKTGGRGAEKMRCIHPNEVDATEGAKRAMTDFAVIRTSGQPRRVDGAVAHHGPHPSIARAYGRDGPPHYRGRQIWRVRTGEPWRWLGCRHWRRGQPQAASARALAGVGAPGDGGFAQRDRALAGPYGAKAGSCLAGQPPTPPQTRSRRLDASLPGRDRGAIIRQRGLARAGWNVSWPWRH